jgi:para-nitrobenzyl esterase
MTRRSISVYRGIRFARAPRFRPPEPIPYSAVAPGSAFGLPAPQNPDPLDFMWGEVLAPGDEDCLSLNVWTPGSDDQRRPVMVYIHGGAFIIGSGRWGWYEGCRLVERGDVVLVTINYRLGAFGFLDLSEIGGRDYEASANCGLLDQVAALEWVRDNIGRFGGDPNNVAVFGESAGGVSICCLLAMARARGLFGRAIVQSGGPNLVRSQSLSLRTASAVLRHAGVNSVAGLCSLSPRDLLAAQASVLSDPVGGGSWSFFPVVDGKILPAPPLHAIRSGAAKTVALLTGSTRDEARLWTLYEPNFGETSPKAWISWLRRLNAPDVAALRAAYRLNRPQASSRDVTHAILGDVLFRMPLIRLAEAQTCHRHDTRMYLFAWETPVRGGRLGSPHAVELPFVFGNLGANGVAELIGHDLDRQAEREALTAAVQGAWITFARTGDPSHAGLPPWPEYETDHRRTLVFDTPCLVRADPLGAERSVWGSVPFDGASPSLEELPF